MAAAVLATLALGCDDATGIFVGGGGGNQTLTEVVITPDGRSVQAGSTAQFQADGVTSTGDTAAINVTWSATGGTITSGGLYTAGQTGGAFRVVARAANGMADTVGVVITIPTTNPTLVAVVVTPSSATVAGGNTAQFNVTGLLSNGGTLPVAVTWTSTGGVISGTGLYTAGALPGNYRVIATGPGALADTSAVTITGAGGG